MSGLLRSEVRRLLHRRVGRIFAIILLAIMVLVLGRMAMVSERLSPESRERIAAEQTRRVRAECRQAGGFGGPEVPLGPDGMPAQFDCDQLTVSPDDVSTFQVSADDGLQNGVKAATYAMLMLGLVLGASYIGAEWGHGTLQALLFWEPRRGRVLLAKAVALVAVVCAATVAFAALIYVAVYAIAATRGSTEGVTAGVHLSNLLTLLRGLVVVSFASLLAFAISGLSRYTAAALGFFAGYFILIENLVRGFRPGWQRFLLSENVTAIVNESTPVAAASGRSVFDEFGTALYTLTGVRGTVTLGIYLALLLGGFYASFTRRDVT